MRSFLVISILLFLNTANAYQNDMSLKGGLGISQAQIKALRNTKDDMTGFGFNTQFGYRFTQFEINLSSYIYWGSIDDLEFNATGTTVAGDGTFRHVSFGPIFKYITNWQPIRDWNFYFGLGPVWSLQTIKLNEFETTEGEFEDKYKLSYRSNGGMLVIGLEEILPFKEMHPVYIELLYSYTKSSRVYLSDASDFAEVRPISEGESRQDIRGNFVMINAGITFF